MTWMTNRKKKIDDEFMRDFDRGLLRGAFVSAFWSVIQARKKEDGLTLKNLADRLGIHKSAVSRWFATEPNWELNTIADIASSLDVDVTVEFVDRKTGRKFTPSGEIVAPIHHAQTMQPAGGVSILQVASAGPPVMTATGGETIAEWRLGA